MYCTLQDLDRRIGTAKLLDLTDRGEVATGQIDTAVVDEAIADACAVIDSYVGVKYAVPMTDVPPIVEDLAKSIAIYKLHTYLPDAKVEKDYEDAMAMLKAIAEGKARLPLPGASSGEVKSTGTTGARVTDRDRPMTEESLKGGFI